MTPGYRFTVVYMMMVCFLGQNILVWYKVSMLAIRSKLATNCSLAILLAVLLHTPSPHWFEIVLSPLPPWSHVSQGTRVGEGVGREGREERMLHGIPEKLP